jgi:hypothetical protein
MISPMIMPAQIGGASTLGGVDELSAASLSQRVFCLAQTATAQACLQKEALNKSPQPRINQFVHAG